MGRRRRYALQKIDSLAEKIEGHIEKMRAEPFSVAYNHWRREVRGWIMQVVTLSRHVGTRTAMEVATRVEQWKKQSDD